MAEGFSRETPQGLVSTDRKVNKKNSLFWDAGGDDVRERENFGGKNEAMAGKEIMKNQYTLRQMYNESKNENMNDIKGKRKRERERENICWNEWRLSRERTGIFSFTKKRKGWYFEGSNKSQPKNRGQIRWRTW